MVGVLGRDGRFCRIINTEASSLASSSTSRLWHLPLPLPHLRLPPSEALLLAHDSPTALDEPPRLISDTPPSLPAATTMADVHTYEFNVSMSCGGCSGAIDRVLKKLPGASPPPSSSIPGKEYERSADEAPRQASRATRSPSRTRGPRSSPACPTRRSSRRLPRRARPSTRPRPTASRSRSWCPPRREHGGQESGRFAAELVGSSYVETCIGGTPCDF